MLQKIKIRNAIKKQKFLTTKDLHFKNDCNSKRIQSKFFPFPSSNNLKKLIPVQSLQFSNQTSFQMSKRVLLPTNIKPEVYKLTLEPDLEKFTFDGQQEVTFKVTEPTKR